MAARHDSPGLDMEKGEEVCGHVADGMSLLMACAMVDGVSRPTFYRWMRESEELRDTYARAREERADLIADECIEIADGADPLTDNPALIKQRIDARKWHAAKLAPKTYGDKIEHDHGTGLTVTINNADADL